MLWSDECDSSSMKPYWRYEQNDRTHWHTKNPNTSAAIKIILVRKIICLVMPVLPSLLNIIHTYQNI